MPTYPPPSCLKGCTYFKTGPQFIGDSGKCSKYKLIPKGIFYRAEKCAYYKPAISSAKVTPSKKK